MLLRSRLTYGTPVLWCWHLVSLVSAQSVSQESGPNALKRLSLEELSQIEISSVSKEPVPAFKTPAAISVITQDDIRRSGATNIPDLLRLVPGVIVSQIDSDKWSIGIRGFQDRLAKSVKVLIDGRSVYTPLFAGVYWEVQDTLIEDIDRIEVIRGPGGTIWGANAVNGVINIITKRAQDTRGTLISAGGGNVEQGFLNWRYGAGSEKLSYRVYGKGFTRGPQYHPSGRNFDDWRMGQTGFRMDWNVTDRDSLTIQGDAYGTIAGQQIQISTFNPPANPAVEGNGDFYGQNVLASWRRILKSGGDMQVRSYYDRTDRQDLNYREIRHTFDLDFIQHKPFVKQEVTWGLGIQVSPSRFFQTAPSVNFIPHEQTYTIASAFLQDEIALMPNRLALTLGTKIEHNSFSDFEFQPGVRLAWTPNDENTVWGAVTRAVRTPSRLEEGFDFNFLAAQNPPLYIRLIGDGKFTPEQLIGYEFGYRTYLKKNVITSLTVFHNRYSDLLSVESRPLFRETSPEPAHLVLPLDLRNGIMANSSGLEIVALWDARSWWRMRGSYSFLGLDARRELGSNDASTVRQLEGLAPSHQVVAQWSLTLPKSFEADLTYRYVSSLPQIAIPAYSTGDVRVGRRLGRYFDLSLIGRNLLQPSHFEFSDNPEGPAGIRRSVYLKLTFTH